MSQRSASRLLKQGGIIVCLKSSNRNSNHDFLATAATKVLQLQKMTSSVGKLSSFSSPRFSPSIKEKKVCDFVLLITNLLILIIYAVQNICLCRRIILPLLYLLLLHYQTLLKYPPLINCQTTRTQICRKRSLL